MLAGAAIAVAAVLALCAFLFVLATNRAAILLSFPALAIAFVYPFFKRFFVLPQAFLGIAFAERGARASDVLRSAVLEVIRLNEMAMHHLRCERSRGSGSLNRSRWPGLRRTSASLECVSLAASRSSR